MLLQRTFDKYFGQNTVYGLTHPDWAALETPWELKYRSDTLLHNSYININTVHVTKRRLHSLFQFHMFYFEVLVCSHVYGLCSNCFFPDCHIYTSCIDDVRLLSLAQDGSVTSFNDLQNT